MEDPLLISGADDLLSFYISAANETEAERALSQLMVQHVTPLIHQIVNYKLCAGTSRSTERESDAEEVCSNVQLKILEKLHQWRHQVKNNEAYQFMDYVAMTSYHFCNQYWRDDNPLRNRIKNRLRYFLTSSNEFAIWKKGGKSVCGFASWEKRSDLSDYEAQDRAIARVVPIESKLEQLKIILRNLNAPILLNDLVSLVMKVEGLNLSGHQNEVLDDIPDPRRNIAIDEVLLKREHLEQLWAEIQELSEKQRKALLLGLRDDQGGAILQLFPSLGIASARQLAAALSMSEKQFGEMWKDLPLDDLRIAAFLGLTRQQVINLRKCARERLVRRVRI
jgi:hypothetical protein